MGSTKTGGRRPAEKPEEALAPAEQAAPALESGGGVGEAPAPLPPEQAPAPSPVLEPPLRTRSEARAAAAKAEPPPVGRYRVWSHGTLQRDGTTYQPGAILELAHEAARKISCLEPVED